MVTFASLTLAAADRPAISRAGFWTDPLSKDDCPGWLAGNWPSPPRDLSCRPWPYRGVTYEIQSSSQVLIARSVYGLARFAGDLDNSVTLERFERGVGGFHYGVDQVAAWANAVRDGRQGLHTEEERDLLKRLAADRVIVDQDGAWAPGGSIRHVLGATATKSRSLELNREHERIHVMWDEDADFRERAIAAWGALSDDEKHEVYKRLKGYNPAVEMQIIEEWAVFQFERSRQESSRPDGASD